MERLLTDTGPENTINLEKAFASFSIQALESCVPSSFYEAYNKEKAKYSAKDINSDRVSIRTTKRLVPAVQIRNPHEAAFVLHTCSAVSLIKTAVSQSNTELANQFLEMAKVEYGKHISCAAISMKASRTIPQNQHEMLLKLGKVFRLISGMTRMGQVAKEIEEYFVHPQNRARIQLIAQTRT